MYEAYKLAINLGQEYVSKGQMFIVLGQHNSEATNFFVYWVL